MKACQNLKWRLFDVGGNVIGYARVSTRGQSLDSQVDALVAAGAVRVFQEYASGATQLRARWKECLDYLQPGNVLTVADLTRLGRSTADLADIVTVLGQRGIGFRSLAEPWLDTTSAHGKLIFDMFASLAEYERSRLSERTKAGLAAARARGRLGGRPRTMTPSKTEAARQLRSQGKTLKEIAQILSVSVSSLTRALSRREAQEVITTAASGGR
ncbi:recombinase family protein [Arthrobacter sp. ISL-85]|uniref:recombinase family protein n=1 Tax=Arthrobacter sp. ISL-85 TaxID=2819115 RepID=UPI001BE70234|nr:recombinase family protein [Arthrobacter sp. ISL-85]MBT2565098.1 recombinase family protein [Arthrobacter sp. ISL-85]